MPGGSRIAAFARRCFTLFRPGFECQRGDAFQILALCPAGRLHRHTMRHTHHKLGQIGRVAFLRQITLGNGPLEPLAQRRFAVGTPLGHFALHPAPSGERPLHHEAAKELGSRKIRVNSVNPGMIETEGATAAGITESDMRKQTEASTPLGRIGQVRDVAPVVVFLASPESGWITGESLFVSGGVR